MRHLRSIEDLDRPAIERILDRAKTFTEVSEREIKKVPALRGRRVLNLFYEASTRTRSSFELAAKSLSADVINFSAKGSSVSKGESLKDTAQTLAAMGYSQPISMRGGFQAWKSEGRDWSKPVVLSKEQKQRFDARARDPLKSWKLSPIDVAAREKYDGYTKAREAMLRATHTEFAPWTLAICKILGFETSSSTKAWPSDLSIDVVASSTLLPSCFVVSLLHELVRTRVTMIGIKNLNRFMFAWFG